MSAPIAKLRVIIIAGGKLYKFRMGMIPRVGDLLQLEKGHPHRVRTVTWDLRDDRKCEVQIQAARAGEK